MKPYFVILQQEEIEKMNTSQQLAVFAAIKSYCANGKNDADITCREISSRSLLAKSWVKPVIDELVNLGLVSRVGTVGHRGGMVQVYRIGTVEKSSVPCRSSSVPKPGTKSIQSKKEINNNTSFLNPQFNGEDKLPSDGWWKLGDIWKEYRNGKLVKTLSHEEYMATPNI